MFLSTVYKNLFNTLTLVLHESQLEELKRILDDLTKKNVTFKEGDGEIQFKVKLKPSTKFVESNRKPFKIDLRKVPCTDLRDYNKAIIDIVLTGESKEFESIDS